ncbi:MAG: hypothetical protein WC495_05570 [Patescibacteria group bacterium]
MSNINKLIDERKEIAYYIEQFENFIIQSLKLTRSTKDTQKILALRQLFIDEINKIISKDNIFCLDHPIEK